MGLTFKEALHLSDDLSWKEKMRMIIIALGYKEVKACIPFSLYQLQEAYKRDRNLNNLELKRWDEAAGFYTKRYSGACKFVGSSLTKLYYNKLRVNIFSCSQGVSILKECARMWIEEEEENGKR